MRDDDENRNEFCFFLRGKLKESIFLFGFRFGSKGDSVLFQCLFKFHSNLLLTVSPFGR